MTTAILLLITGIILLYLMSLISPCRHLCNAFQSWSWSANQTMAWFFIFADGVLIVNRIFFRTSVRKLWAYTLGDSNFRSVLKFESSDGGTTPSDVGFNVEQPADYEKHGSSRMRLILTGIILIAVVVWALNYQKGGSQKRIKKVNEQIREITSP